MEDELFTNVDAGCYVLSRERTPEIVYRVLNRYIPNHEELPGDYTFPNNQPYHRFNTEHEIISFTSNKLDEEQLLLWNGPSQIVVGADFTSDGMIIISVELPANGKDEYRILTELKTLLNSECGFVTHGSVLEFTTGQDFLDRYCT